MSTDRICVPCNANKKFNNGSYLYCQNGSITCSSGTGEIAVGTSSSDRLCGSCINNTSFNDGSFLTCISNANCTFGTYVTLQPSLNWVLVSIMLVRRDSLTMISIA